jgi:hypothetical protein
MVEGKTNVKLFKDHVCGVSGHLVARDKKKPEISTTVLISWFWKNPLFPSVRFFVKKS